MARINPQTPIFGLAFQSCFTVYRVNPRVRAPLLGASTCLGGFILLLLAAYEVPYALTLDATALHGLAALQGPVATPIAVAASHLADPLPVVGILAALLVLGRVWGRERQAVAAAVLVVMAILTAEGLKLLLAHPRVGGVVGLDQPGAAAFPSGHATASVALALAAVLVAPRRIRPFVAVAAAAYAIAVCMSILVLVWHFPSDVFGGMLVASFYFSLAVAALRAERQELPRPMDRLSPGLRPSRWWREGLGAVAAVVAIAALARAGDLAAFAADHTAATAVAIAVTVCAASLVAVAGLTADR